MTKLVFHIQGSAPEPYTVVIEKVGDRLTALCDCQAGAMGQACKHRFSLFEGSSKNVIGGDISKVSEVPAMVAGTEVSEAIALLRFAEKEEEAAKKRVQAAKKAISRIMQGN
ncbi:MAG: hypothetical protein ACT4OK_05610 [Gemmobacter sp.]